MKILGIETSCDETSVAVIGEGPRILSNCIASQVQWHQQFGGVVPEIAARRHVEIINLILTQALEEAGCRYEEISAIAVTSRPGLVGALLVGVSAGKALSLAFNLPLMGVHHLEGHIYSGFLVRPDLSFPILCLIVSGGHTDLILMKGHGQYEILGRTRDDAAGEAFDKGARAMGLGYPGGPEIDKKSREGNPSTFFFPRADLGDTLDFSFSGLKTALLRFLKERPDWQDNLPDLCASYQEAIVDMLLHTLHRAVEQKGVRNVIIAGGVAANRRLKAKAEALAQELSLTLVIPPPILCTDNAAMIATAGYYRYLHGKMDGLDLETVATVPIESW